MTTTALLETAPDLAADDYCVLGLATCFVQEEGEIEQLTILEPIPSAALEALIKGIPTSYQVACAVTLSQIFQNNQVEIPKDFRDLQIEQDIQLCDRFEERVAAATRTYKSRPEAKEHLLLGTIKQDFNYSLSRKRVLNNTRSVSAADNVKQHSHTHKVL